MNVLITVLVGLIIVFHVYVFVLEALLWERPQTLKAFGTTPQVAAASRPLAINQGVYNLFLAAGLGGSLWASDPIGFQAKIFFLSCIIVAALTAGAIVSKRIMLIQGLPALITLSLVIVNS